MVQSLKLGGAANDEAEAGIKRINRLPIIVVILGVIVGSMVIAMYLPIFKLAAVV